MGAVFALAFAAFAAFCGIILGIIGLLLRKKIKVLAVVLFILAAICMVPAFLMTVILVSGIISSLAR